MHLSLMRPEQIGDSVRRNVPVLMAAGSVEYHGPHLPIGTDHLIAEAVCREVHGRCECVLAPTFPFAPTMSWAASPGEGEIDFDPEPLGLYAREVFRSFVRMGFGRICVLQHHQGPEGLQSLCLRRAAAEVVREVSTAWGAEWGRRDPATLPIPGIFSLIRVAYVDSFSSYAVGQEQIPIGHGGKGETQLIMATHPETVAMDRLGAAAARPEWLRDAHLGTADEGRRWIEFCARGWVAELERREPA